jgi:4-hydroxybenzoate polyprenyltransferase
MINGLIRLLRPHQWTKQAIVLLPILSLGSAFSILDFGKSILAAGIYSLAAGAVYILNDLVDVDFDRKDPVRKLRPLAAGQVSKNHAIFFLFFLLVLMATLNILFADDVVLSGMVLFTYLIVNFGYSKFHLKKHNILGIAIVSMGFSLRFAYGSFFLSIELSYWALVLLMELSLFMLSIKRFQMSTRQNAQSSGNPGIHEFWLLAAVIFASVFMASFAGFITSPETQEIWGKNALLLSTIPMALGMVRFIEIATNFKEYSSTDATDIVVRDIPMLVLVTIFIVVLLTGRLTVGG